MKYGAIILCLTLLMVQFRLTMVQLDYVMNKEYISQFLCIEKDLAASSCEGQCHLKKELSKVETGSDTPDENKLRIAVVELTFLSDCFTEIEQGTSSSYFLDSIAKQNPTTLSGFHSIFIPPPELV